MDSMDRRMRELERRAQEGDPEALEHLHYSGCRLGHHVLQLDQIIQAEDWQQAQQDAGCCQCGKEFYDAKQLCAKGHHRWYRYYNPWDAEMAYRCVRPSLTLDEYLDLSSRARWAYQDGHLDIAQEIEDELNSYRNSYVRCRAILGRNEACSQGLHFLEVTPQGRVCRNPDCDYSESEACKHLYRDSIRRNAEGEEVASCTDCRMSFYGSQICQQWGHKPNPQIGNPCIRPSCAEFVMGTDIYSALAQSYHNTGRLEAVCYEEDKLICEAYGWDEKLKNYGVKKPRIKDIKERYTENFLCRWPTGRLGALVYHITVKTPRGDSVFYRGVNYRTVRENLKSQWAGKWYPLAAKIPEAAT